MTDSRRLVPRLHGLPPRWSWLVFGIGLLCLLLPATPAAAFQFAPSAGPVIVTEQGVVRQGGGAPGRPMAVPGGETPQAPDGTPQGDAKPAEGEAKPAEEGKAEEKPAETVKRPAKPPRVPDPREFDAKLDANQRVKFSFHGQPWPDVLQWLASLGGYSLDWQELPNDYINLAATRSYSVTETRDLLNRLLFERGYAMILRGDVLLVVKIDKLDPSLLPRVDDEADLVDLPAHDFVKITFTLPEKLKADQAAADAKLLLSKHAQVQPLMATNRLLVIDLVGNLREVSRLINQEHAAALGQRAPREFPIRFARADYVADQVMILLGLDPATRRTPQELQVEQQKLQLFMQMQQRGSDVSKYLRPGETPSVHIAVNPRNNSVLVNAPQAELEIIARAIEMLDVPSGMLAGATSAELTMEKYQLATLSPEAMVTALEEIADLDPRSRFKLDTDAKIVFASATTADHAKIQAVIGQLDGSGRQFEVIWLRRLPADAVAETVYNLMIGKQEEQKENNSDYYYFGYRSQQQKKPEPAGKGFRVDADIEHNRLLLWANEAEMEEVRRFLVKLGEIPGEAGNPNTVRVLGARGGDDTLMLLERLRGIWPAAGGNPLRIEGAQPPASPAESSPAQQPPTEQAPAAVDPASKNAAAPAAGRQPRLARFAVAAAAGDSAESQPLAGAVIPDASAADASASEATRVPAPVTVTVNQDGRLILSSSDTEALDRLEELIGRLAPPPKNYEVFYLKYALASLVTLNLEEYFAEDKNAKSNQEENYWRGWYGAPMTNSSDDTRSGLSQRRKIRFIYDFDTNSVLVSHASPEQLETVRELIEVYDKPPSEDSISARRFQLFQLKFAKAEDVSATIKDVYRDLLSSKDQVFQRGQGEKEQASQSTNYYRVYGSSGESEDKKPTKVKASFAGALSVGIDPVSNTLIVSAQEEWMSSITEMIEYLDRQAQPHRGEVRVLHTGLGAKGLQAALLKALGPTRQAAPAQNGPQNGGPAAPMQPPTSNQQPAVQFDPDF